MNFSGRYSSKFFRGGAKTSGIFTGNNRQFSSINFMRLRAAQTSIYQYQLGSYLGMTGCGALSSSNMVATNMRSLMANLAENDELMQLLKNEMLAEVNEEDTL